MGEQDVMKMQQRRDFLIKFCYWAVIDISAYNILPGYVGDLDEQEQPRMGAVQCGMGACGSCLDQGDLSKSGTADRYHFKENRMGIDGNTVGVYGV